MAEGGEDKDRDYAKKVELLKKNLYTLRLVDSTLLRLNALLEIDSTTSNQESGAEEVDGEQGNADEKQSEKPPESSNSTEVGPESPAPATMEGLGNTIPTPGKSEDGVITESEEAQLKPENETSQSFEESHLNAEKLPETPSGEGADDSITTAESNGAFPKEQAHVEDVKNSSAQVPQDKIDQKSEFSSNPGNSNTEVTAEISLPKFDDNGNPIPEKPILVEPKSENSARLESSVNSPQEYNSGESTSVNTPKDSVAESLEELGSQVFGNLSKPEIAQKEQENSVKESPESRRTESNTALQSESLDTETSAVDVAVDSSPKDQDDTKPPVDPCKQSYNITDDKL